MLINFYCFTSHVYYFQLEIYDKTIIESSLWFSPLKMYNKTIIGFGFCDMQNYQCLGKSYQITLTSTLIILHITKTSSNNCLLLYEYRDLFIDMAVRNSRSELAIANRHQERWNFTSEKSSFTAFDWTNNVFSLVKIYRSAFWLADHKCATPARRLV